MFELAAYPVDQKHQSTNTIETVVEHKDLPSTLDKTLADFIIALQQNHSPFLSELTTENNIQLPQKLREKMEVVASQLNINNAVKNEIEKLLSKVYINTRDEIKLSASSEGEFLIYTHTNGTYKNLLIDEDGDVEVLIIPADKSKTFNRRFYSEDGLNLSSVVRALNEMRE